MAGSTVSPILAAPSATTATSLASATGSSSLGKDDFMKLLVTQLQNQDPMDPMKNTDFIAQLAQFSSLQGVQQLNSSISSMLVLQQVTQGAGLIGKKITFTVPGKTLPQSGLVDAVNVNNGKVALIVGPQTVGMDQLVTIAPGSTP